MTVFALSLALVLAFAIPLAALARPAGAAALVVAVYVVAAAEIVAVSLVLSAIGRYGRTELLVALAAAALAACALVVRVRPPVPPSPLRPVVAVLRRSPLLTVLTTAVTAGVAYELGLVLFTPQNDGDALQYHLTRAVFWRQQEAIGYVSGVEDLRINAFPPVAEILTGFTMVGSGSVRLVGLVQLTAMLATAAAVVGIARRTGIDPRGALAGGLLFLTLPIVALQASTSFNDVVVASFVAAAALFALGRARVDVALAGVAFALLVGTKVTAALAVPTLLALVLVAHRGRQRLALLCAGCAGAVVGAGWFVLNLSRTGDVLGDFPAQERGSLDLPSIAARASRQLINTISLPGAVGLDKLVFVIAAVVVLAVGIAVSRRRGGGVAVPMLAAALTVSPLLLLPSESGLLRVYKKTWYVLGREDLGGIDPGREITRAGVMFSWYGPLSVLLALLAAVVAVRAWRRGALPATVLVLVAAPLAWILALAVAVTYFEWNGRFTMGGFALSAATWGLVFEERRLEPAAWAAVAVGATSLLLALVHYDEKPSGLRLLEDTGRQSVWTTPRWLLQTTGAGHGELIREAERRVPDGAVIAIWPSPTPSGGVWGTPPPYPFVGHTTITHRVELARSLDDAERVGAGWAILPATRVPTCADGWRVTFAAAGWRLLERDTSFSCPAR